MDGCWHVSLKLEDALLRYELLQVLGFLAPTLVAKSNNYPSFEEIQMLIISLGMPVRPEYLQRFIVVRLNANLAKCWH